MKYLGLDLGTTTLGIAKNDELGIVHIYENFSFEPGNFKKARTHLNEVIKKEKIEKIVIGLPLQLDGVEGKRAASTRRFIDDYLSEFGSIEVIYQDERYTTIEAKERLQAYGYKQVKIDQMIDAMSAVIILEDYLRKEKNNGR
jgi:putative Holliday junction resolvase